MIGHPVTPVLPQLDRTISCSARAAEPERGLQPRK